jgi:hypothetical protein
MEIIFNLVWVLMAVAFVRLWTRYARKEGTSRWLQAIALATLIVILLPVISVTDDLQAIQNPAELECGVRRNHAASNPDSIHPVVAALPLSAFAKPSVGLLYLVALASFPFPSVDNPALAPIQNRPPPAA